VSVNWGNLFSNIASLILPDFDPFIIKLMPVAIVRKLNRTVAKRKIRGIIFFYFNIYWFILGFIKIKSF